MPVCAGGFLLALTGNLPSGAALEYGVGSYVDLVVVPRGDSVQEVFGLHLCLS
jgi:hypothetical protein